MALDTRDYWKRWHNRRSRYKEKAGFRLGEADHRRRQYRKAWRGNFIRWGLFFLGLVLVSMARKYWH